jgi:hypothetical protein
VPSASDSHCSRTRQVAARLLWRATQGLASAAPQGQPTALPGHRREAFAANRLQNRTPAPNRRPARVQLGALTCAFSEVDDRTRTHDTQDHNGVIELQPFLGVDEVLLARVLTELFLKGRDNPADVVLGAPVGSRNEDHAVVSWAARQHGFDV